MIDLKWICLASFLAVMPHVICVLFKTKKEYDFNMIRLFYFSWLILALTNVLGWFAK